MIARNVTLVQLILALEQTDKLFGGNIAWNRLPTAMNQAKTSWQFTLTVNETRGPGGRLSHTGRRVHAACWHVHGHFFDALLALEPKAVIKTGLHGSIRIDANGGNWQDSNIGSQMYSMYYSEACECAGNLTLKEALR